LKQASLAALTAVAILAAAPVAAQQDFSKVEIKASKVRGNIWMLNGAGGNIGVSVGPDGILIVDDKFAPLAEKIRAALKEVGGGQLKFILNTHWHGDHTGGNENMGKAGALIVAHANVRKRMNPAEFKDLVGSSQQSPARALPVVTFSEELTFHWNGETIHAVHVANSHTDGDAIVFFEQANVVHMGDTFFQGRYPFIDVASGGSIQGMIASSNLVLGLLKPGTRLIPGHGVISDATGLTGYRDMLLQAQALVAPLVQRGMSENEVVAAQPTAALDVRWGASERFVRNVYQSLKGR